MLVQAQANADTVGAGLATQPVGVGEYLTGMSLITPLHI